MSSGADRGQHSDPAIEPGELPRFDVADAVMERRRATIALVRALAEQGVEPQRTWVAEGSLDREAAEVRWIAEHRPLFDG